MWRKPVLSRPCRPAPVSPQASIAHGAALGLVIPALWPEALVCPRLGPHPCCWWPWAIASCAPVWVDRFASSVGAVPRACPDSVRPELNLVGLSGQGRAGIAMMSFTESTQRHGRSAPLTNPLPTRPELLWPWDWPHRRRLLFWDGSRRGTHPDRGERQAGARSRWRSCHGSGRPGHLRCWPPGFA